MFAATQVGVPRALAAWMIWAVEGFSEVALGLAGAKDVRVIPRGNLAVENVTDGIETVSLAWTISWRAERDAHTNAT